MWGTFFFFCSLLPKASNLHLWLHTHFSSPTWQLSLERASKILPLPCLPSIQIQHKPYGHQHPSSPRASLHGFTISLSTLAIFRCKKLIMITGPLSFPQCNNASCCLRLSSHALFCIYLLSFHCRHPSPGLCHNHRLLTSSVFSKSLPPAVETVFRFGLILKRILV